MDELEKKLVEMPMLSQMGSKDFGMPSGPAGFLILRVPGGWVITQAASSCFVPEPDRPVASASEEKPKPKKKTSAKKSK